MFELVPFRDRHLPARDYFSHLMHGLLAEDFFAPFGAANAFRVDLRETENAYIVEADLPGVKKGDITLHYESPYLTIAAKRDETQEVKDENYVRKERRSGQFQRSIYVDNIAEAKIDAKFSDGVLTITLPKQDKTKKRKGNIPIQ